MKRSFGVAIIVICIIVCSCQDQAMLPDTGYIKSDVNGVETVYSTEVKSAISNFMTANEFHISFQKKDNKYVTWTIDVTGVDLQQMTFPFVISGPKETGLNEPTFWCNINDSDPKNSSYGRNLVGTTSLYWNAKLTLTSVDGNVVTGTFEGQGRGRFANGEFRAVFK